MEIIKKYEEPKALAFILHKTTQFKKSRGKYLDAQKLVLLSERFIYEQRTSHTISLVKHSTLLIFSLLLSFAY